MNHLFTRQWLTPRNLCFLGFVMLAVAFAAGSLRDLVQAALQYDQYTHVLIVLPVSAALLYLDAGRVFRTVKYDRAAIAGLALAAIAFFYIPNYTAVFSAATLLSLSILCMVVWLISAFVLSYGVQAFWTARFPLLFLLLLVPIPPALLDRTVSVLQNSSAEVTYWLLRIAQVPVFRRGVVLSLPGIDIEVAKECSGIRSSLMLFLVSLVLAHLFLHGAWRKALLTVAVFPITIFKNALRIFTLSTLSVYVNPSFLSGRLHEFGGIPFFVLALASLVLVLWLLQRSQKIADDKNPGSPLRGTPVFLNSGA